MGYGDVLLVVDENVQEPRVIAGMQQGDPGWGVEPADAVAALRVIEPARTSALEQRVVRLEGTR